MVAYRGPVSLKLALAGAISLCCFATLGTAQESGQPGGAVGAAPQLVLQPPADLSAACGPATFHHFTAHWRNCATAFMMREDPDEDCCQGLAAYYGPNALFNASANCFCDKGVWSQVVDAEDTTYYPMKTALLVCARMGHIVPFYDEDEDGNVTGYCFGKPPDQDTLDAAVVDDHSAGAVPSVRDYVGRLKQDGLVMLSFITGPISGFGVLLLLWPLVWEAAMQLRDSVANCCQKRV